MKVLPKFYTINWKVSEDILTFSMIFVSRSLTTAAMHSFHERLREKIVWQKTLRIALYKHVLYFNCVLWEKKKSSANEICCQILKLASSEGEKTFLDVWRSNIFLHLSILKTSKYEWNQPRTDCAPLNIASDFCLTIEASVAEW